MTVTVAEGYAELRMWREAWEVLDELPPTRRASCQALRVRLKCCPMVGAWKIGEQVAMLLRDGARRDRGSAAAFYHLNARRLLAAGDREGSKVNILAAVDTFPECRTVLLADRELAAEFF
ncbi:MAG TPA: hypothetical protein VGE67_20315 [Haloferula sp.]